MWSHLQAITFFFCFILSPVFHDIQLHLQLNSARNPSTHSTLWRHMSSFFFFCVSKGKEGRRKQHRQVYVRLPLPLPLSISHVVLFTSKPISHACILCVFHRCQASVTFVCVCAFFFFLSPLCRIAVATPRFFFLFFFFQKKKKKRGAKKSFRFFLY